MINNRALPKKNGQELIAPVQFCATNFTAFVIYFLALAIQIVYETTRNNRDGIARLFSLERNILRNLEQGKVVKVGRLGSFNVTLKAVGKNTSAEVSATDILKGRVRNVFFGEMYLLSVQLNEWEEYITVKYVQKSDKGDDYVRLASQNGNHQPKDVHITKISALALIKASIRINTMM